MTLQKDWFAKINTDYLLSLRYLDYCQYPDTETDLIKPEYRINKTLLFEELAKRPHRVRAKDRRKINLKK